MSSVMSSAGSTGFRGKVTARPDPVAARLAVLRAANRHRIEERPPGTFLIRGDDDSLSDVTDEVLAAIDAGQLARPAWPALPAAQWAIPLLTPAGQDALVNGWTEMHLRGESDDI